MNDVPPHVSAGTADGDRREHALLYREAGAGEMPAENEEAWQRWALWPRAFSGVGGVSVATEIVGQTLDLPVVVAPTALHGLWHAGAEAETSKGVGAAGSLLTLSQISTLPPENLATGPYLQQLYLPERRELAVPFVRRAEAAGAVGLVVTVDQLPVPSTQPFREVGRSLPWPTWSVFDAGQDGAEPAKAFTPGDITWLREISSLPVIAKGILHPDDAVAAVNAGAAGIVVSNHGGRQLAGSVTTAEVLTDIVVAVGGQVPIHVDSGIRTATDVFRALCLGASTAWLGRPVLRALEAGGANAVETLLIGLRDELLSIFRLVGISSPADARPGLLRRRD